MTDDLYAHGIEVEDLTIMEPGEHEVTLSTAARENWHRMALQWLRVMVGKGALTRFTTGEVARMAYLHDLSAPPDVRAWGLVIQTAKNDGIIRQFTVKGAPVTVLSPSRHSTPVWEAA